MAELRIPIIVENKGTKAFKSAGKDLNSLEKGVKKLAGTLAATFGAQQLLKFAKDAAKAFIEDERAAAQLAQTVKNLGLAFETPRIEKFISELSMASGVADDQFRPSMQKLLQVTGSVAKSQDILTKALDVSRGSGVEFETVVQDLASAYVGNTKGLRKYNLGLTQAELKTMSFADVQERLGKLFSGANAAYLETYAGKMQLLTTAAGEAKENIGKGLVDALSLLAGDGNTVQPLADSMLEFSQSVSDAIVGVGVLINKLKDIPGADLYVKAGQQILNFQFGPYLKLFKQLEAMGAASRPLDYSLPQYLGSMPSGIYETPAQASARKKAEADAAKRAKEIAALQKKTLDTQKKQNALTKAAKTIDLERIGLTAALRGKVSEADRISLQLQLALLDKNDSLATKLSAELEAATKRQQTLNAALLATPEAPNPYRNWVPPALQSMYDSQQYFGPQGGLGAGVVAGVNPPVNVQVVIDGKEVASAVTDVQVNQSLSGTFSDVNRVAARGSVGIR